MKHILFILFLFLVAGTGVFAQRVMMEGGVQDTTLKFNTTTKTLEIGRKSDPSPGTPYIKFKNYFPDATNTVAKLLFDYGELRGKSVRPSFRWYSFDTKDVTESAHNSVVKWGWNVDGFQNSAKSSSWYAMERSYAPPGVDSVNAWIENHLSMRNPGGAGGEVRLFSATTRPALTLAAARSQWDFRGEIFNVATLQNTSYFGLEYTIPAKQTNAKFYSPSHTLRIQVDSATTTTQFFPDLFGSNSPKLTFNGWSTIQLGGVGADVFTQSTRTLSVNNLSAPNLLYAGNITVPVAFDFKVGNDRWMRSGSGINGVWIGRFSGPTSQVNASVVAIGNNTAQQASNGVSMVVIGEDAARSNTGTNNVIIGNLAVGQNSCSNSVVIGPSAMFNQGLSDRLWVENTSTGTPLLSGHFNTNRVGINKLNAHQTATLDISSLVANTNAILHLQSTTDSIRVFVTSTNPNTVLNGRPGDLAHGTDGALYGKFSGSNTTSGWGKFLNLIDANTATSGQVLAWNGTAWAPATNSSESTKIGAFTNSGTTTGISMSADSIKLHAATISTPGAVNITAQVFSAGTAQKTISADNGFQLRLDDPLATKSAGLQLSESGGTNVMMQMTASSPDADNGNVQLKVEKAASLETYIEVGALNDKDGIYEKGGLYEDAPTEITATTATLQYGQRNLLLNATDMVFTMQTIGTGAGETKPGRVVYFFNDNATAVTLTGGGGQDIIDANTLLLSANTAVTLIATTSGKWVIKG